MMSGAAVVVMMIFGLLLPAIAIFVLIFAWDNHPIRSGVVAFVLFCAGVVLLSLCARDCIKTNEYWQANYGEIYHKKISITVIIILAIVCGICAIVSVGKTISEATWLKEISNMHRESKNQCVTEITNKSLKEDLIKKQTASIDELKLIDDPKTILSKAATNKEAMMNQLTLIDKSKEVLAKVINSTSEETDIEKVALMIRRANSKNELICRSIDEIVLPNIKKLK